METSKTKKIVKSGGVFRPMLFSTLMVHALLRGTKTQTRRVVKAGFDLEKTSLAAVLQDQAYFKDVNSLKNMWLATKIPNAIGDIIWVRETYFDTSIVPKAELFKGVGKNVYKADNAFIGCNNWRPSLFMPKEACRLWLRVTDVRVERLTDITEEDAEKEGLLTEELMSEAFRKHFGYSVGYKNYLSKHTAFVKCPIKSYKSLWESINGKGSWDANPFVWVYEFEVLRDAPEGFR